MEARSVRIHISIEDPPFHTSESVDGIVELSETLQPGKVLKVYGPGIFKALKKIAQAQSDMRGHLDPG